MNAKLSTTALFAVMSAASLAASAPSAASPVGRWKSFDEETGQAKSIISLYVEKDELKARIDSLLPVPGKDPNRVCEKCDGDRKGKRIQGMIVAWGLALKENAWEGGRILDPANGKIYRCRITMDPGGKTLTVRGFIGFSLLGRSQKWERVN